jgi:hypothetical protein
MGAFCIVIDGREPDGGDLVARHNQASASLGSFVSHLRSLGMGVTFAGLLTPADGDESAASGAVAVAPDAAAPPALAPPAPVPPIAAVLEPTPSLEPAAPAAVALAASPIAPDAAVPPDLAPAEAPAPGVAVTFKCPECGRDYVGPGVCVGGEYGHPAVEVLPVDQVVNAPAVEASPVDAAPFVPPPLPPA